MRRPVAIALGLGALGALALASSSSSASRDRAWLDVIDGGARLMQSYGNHTRNGVTRFHWGVDLAAPVGRAIYAVAPGTVAGAWPDGELVGTGNCVSLRHDGDLQATVYMHLRDLAVRTGDRVARGQLLGHVGCTDSTPEGFNPSSAHLHFEVLALRAARDAAHFDGHGTPPRLDPAVWAPAHHVRLTRA